MISEQQQEQASLYALGALSDEELRAFEAELHRSAELQALTRELQSAIDLTARALPGPALPASLRDKVLRRIEAEQESHSTQLRSGVPVAGLQFLNAPAQKDWKPLPVPGAFIKLLSISQDSGYAVLLGKLDPGVRYPAHVNVGPEDFYILTGDLVIGDRKLVAGDFHHADAGSHHVENYSVGGCTLLAVLTTKDPLVAFAMA
jgi:anti-sigma factor ChrR (cupin superfamily)